MIGTANNTFVFTDLFEDLLYSIETYRIYTTDEINTKIQYQEIISSLNIICNFCIFRFVVDLFNVILERFEHQFLELDTGNIIVLCNEIYSEFEIHVNPKIKQKVWKEVLNNIVSNYLICLFISENALIKNIEDLKMKIKKDNQAINKFFYNKIGAEAASEVLKNLDYFLEFLESSLDMIALPCKSLRDFNGESFTIDNAKALINLRCDFTPQEKETALEICNEVLNNYKDEKDKKFNPLFDFLKQKINNNSKRVSYSDSSKIIEDDDLKLINTGKRISKRELLDFGIELSDSDQEDLKIEDEENKNKSQNFFVPKKSIEFKEAEIAIIYAGEMKKKSHDM